MTIKKIANLAEALRGMRMKNWERRETSEGKVVVYVRYVEQTNGAVVPVENA